MKWAFIAEIVNAGIFLLWMVGFANPLPSVFLIVPFLIIVTHWLTRGRPRNEELWGGIGCFLDPELHSLLRSSLEIRWRDVSRYSNSTMT